MKSQLRHLVELSLLPNVTLQVLPFAVGSHPGHNGSFTTLVTDDLAVVLVENLTAGWYLEDLEAIRHHDLVFDHLRATALSPVDSRSLIERLVSTL